MTKKVSRPKGKRGRGNTIITASERIGADLQQLRSQLVGVSLRAKPGRQTRACGCGAEIPASDDWCTDCYSRDLVGRSIHPDHCMSTLATKADK